MFTDSKLQFGISIDLYMEPAPGNGKNYTNMKNNSFEDLMLWQESTHLILELYQSLIDYKDEYLREQVQRLAVAIASDIDKGFDRQNYQDALRFFHKALRLCSELKNHLLAFGETKGWTEDTVVPALEKSRQLSAMLYRLIHHKKVVTHPLYNPLSCAV